MLPMYDLIQILNHLLLDFITFINENSKELCAYVIIRVNVTALLV